MKRFIVIAITAAFFTQPALALGGETLNAKASEQFNADFNGASGLWDTQNNYSEVLFYWHNTLMDAYYTPDGDLIGTFHHVEVSALPARALAKIAQRYKGYVLKGASLMDRPELDSVYYVTVRSARRAYLLEVSMEGGVCRYKKIR